MFKRLLGIKKIEKKLDKTNESMGRSWEWISYLNKLNSSYEKRLEQLETGQKRVLELINSLLDDEELGTQQAVEQPFIKLPRKEENIVNFSDKTLTILQIIYGYAAFNSDTAITTNNIAEHLNYKITERGLRKKLKGIVEQGVLKSIKKGNTRFWYLNSDKLMKVKKALTEQ